MNRQPDWTQTSLTPAQYEGLSGALTAEQAAHLAGHDYVWVAGTGVLWKDLDGDMRRARFTHGAYFRTRHGEYYVDSEGSARAVSRSPTDTAQEPA